MKLSTVQKKSLGIGAVVAIAAIISIYYYKRSKYGTSNSAKQYRGIPDRVMGHGCGIASAKEYGISNAEQFEKMFNVSCDEYFKTREQRVLGIPTGVVY